jgi:hypothetical protein
MNGISEDVLFEISKAFEMNYLDKDEELLIKHNDVHFAFMIIFDGIAQIKISADKVYTFAKNDIIYSDIFAIRDTFSLRALTDLRFYSLDQEVYNSLMFDHTDFRNVMFELIESV